MFQFFVKFIFTHGIYLRFVCTQDNKAIIMERNYYNLIAYIEFYNYRYVTKIYISLLSPLFQMQFSHFFSIRPSDKLI